MPNHHNGQIENFQLKRLIEIGEDELCILKAIHFHQHQDLAIQHKILRTLRYIATELAPPKQQILSEVKIAFVKGPPMSTPVVGPIVIAPGDTAQAVLLGFDQVGAPFNGTMPASTLSSDDTAGSIVTFDPASGQTVGVAAGVANITGSVDTTDANGNPITLTDTETVTVVSAPPPAQVLSSVKVGFITSVPQATPLK